MYWLLGGLILLLFLQAVFGYDGTVLMFVFFFFKQKTAYKMRISDWSSDVCSSDLAPYRTQQPNIGADRTGGSQEVQVRLQAIPFTLIGGTHGAAGAVQQRVATPIVASGFDELSHARIEDARQGAVLCSTSGNVLLSNGKIAASPEVVFEAPRLFLSPVSGGALAENVRPGQRSEEHTSALQSLLRISYVGFYLK